MNLKSILLYSFILFIPLQAVENEALTKLWQGVTQSNVKLVKEALAEGADPSIRAGRYGDTATMTAIRIYGQQITLNQKPKLSKKAFAYSAALTTGILTNFVINKFFPEEKSSSIFIPIIMFGVFDLASNLSINTTPAPAKIVELLINADQNIALRNKEGLDALDILRAYFSIAYQAQDKHWYKLLYLLHKKGQQH